MFYLAERYGDGIFDERITDHVPDLADHPGWQPVTALTCSSRRMGRS